MNRPPSTTAYRLAVPARSPYGAGISSSRTFTHRVWRDIFTRGLRTAEGQGRFFDGESGTATMAVGANDVFHVKPISAGCVRLSFEGTAYSYNQAPVRLALSTGAEFREIDLQPAETRWMIVDLRPDYIHNIVRMTNLDTANWS